MSYVFKFSAEEEIKLIHAYLNGESVDSLIENYQTARTTIYAILRRHGHKPNRKSIGDPSTYPPCPHCQNNNIYKAGLRVTRKGKRQNYKCNDCRHIFWEWLDVDESQDNITEYEKDIWCVCNLGLKVPLGRGKGSLNFTDISPSWLLIATKQFMRYSLSTCSFSTTSNRLISVRRFALFLKDFYPAIQPSDINRSIIIHFLSSLIDKYAVQGRRDDICNLNTFFQLCYRNGWVDTPKEPLFFTEDYPKIPKLQPRYIPQEVIEQLNKNLDALPPPIMRMILMLQECGMRIIELCLLPFNCLMQDAQGDWFLRYYQYKMKREHSIPISKELVAVIQEQQKYIKDNFDEDYEYLFCSNRTGTKAGDSISGKRPFVPVAKPLTQCTFSNYINCLSKEKNICDVSGKIWRFQSHQFRHTVGTRMINNGVPQHIVQRYLGHEAADMTARYAHIHDQTLKKEIAHFQGKVVNIAGQVIESENPELESSDLQWFKRNVHAQALPNGSCARPIIKGACPHANACLTCGDFRTTLEFLNQHKEQLDQTEKIIEKATANNWQRQLEMNEQVKTNLENIISFLESE